MILYLLSVCDCVAARVVCVATALGSLKQKYGEGWPSPYTNPEEARTPLKQQWPNSGGSVENGNVTTTAPDVYLLSCALNHILRRRSSERPYKIWLRIPNHGSATSESYEWPYNLRMIDPIIPDCGCGRAPCRLADSTQIKIVVGADVGGVYC